MTMQEQAPVGQKERIVSLDVLRGFAILGILVMNIQSFSMPGATYLNPAAYGDLTGANQWVWVISHIFADSKFMTIFSVLFGAGIIVFSQNVEKRTGQSAALHYQRNLWLLVIGLIHAHLIWYGDILVSYALCSFLVYLLRKKQPRTLFILGVLVIAVHTLIYGAIGMGLKNAPPENLAGLNESWRPAPEQIAHEIAAYTGSYLEQTAARSEEAFFMETMVFLMLFLWRAAGLMLVGMALFKWGVLSAERSESFYRRGILAGFLVGLPIVIFGMMKNFEVDWDVRYSMFLGSQFNYWGSLFISFAYISTIMLLVKRGALSVLAKRLAAVGQMALTNYLTQSIIATFLFYGIGFSFFGQVERMYQVLIVIGIWLLQLLWSPWWLKRYRFGPFEWVWRSLTYRHQQPWKR